MLCSPSITYCFYFNSTATTEIYTLSLHDALPIFREYWWVSYYMQQNAFTQPHWRGNNRLAIFDDAGFHNTAWYRSMDTGLRSEEHTSELQLQSNLVCRLLLEKKKHETR